MIQTPCAYHSGELITHFCKCPRCLLPLCSQCIPIHKNEHLDLHDSIVLMGIHEVIDQVGCSINAQSANLQIFINETVGHFRNNDESHRKILHEISKQKQALLDCVNSVYDNALKEAEANRNRRQGWLRDFMGSITEIKEEFASLLQSLRKQKYLRTVIMWNRLRPEETMDQIIHRSRKQWLSPTFTTWDLEKFAHTLVAHMNFKLLEIEGDTGSLKLLRLLRTLRYGQETANQLSNSQVSSLNHKSPFSPAHTNSTITGRQSPSTLLMKKPSHKKISVLSALDKI